MLSSVTLSISVTASDVWGIKNLYLCCCIQIQRRNSILKSRFVLLISMADMPMASKL